jgi:hypothetical protein
LPEVSQQVFKKALLELASYPENRDVLAEPENRLEVESRGFGWVVRR